MPHPHNQPDPGAEKVIMAACIALTIALAAFGKYLMMVREFFKGV